MKDRLKFRAFDENEKIMRYFDMFDLKYGNYVSIQTKSGDFKPSDIKPFHKVMQSTGLKDSTGKLIYEGDIVETANKDIAIIKHGEYRDQEILDLEDYVHEEYYCDRNAVGYFAYHLKNKGNYALDNATQRWVKIIGNIYETPELLTQEVE